MGLLAGGRFCSPVGSCPLQVSGGLPGTECTARLQRLAPSWLHRFETPAHCPPEEPVSHNALPSSFLLPRLLPLCFPSPRRTASPADPTGMCPSALHSLPAAFLILPSLAGWPHPPVTSVFVLLATSLFPPPGPSSPLVGRPAEPLLLKGPSSWDRSCVPLLPLRQLWFPHAPQPETGEPF